MKPFRMMQMRLAPIGGGRLLVAGTGDYLLTGTTTSPFQSRRIVAVSGAYGLAGTAALLTQTTRIMVAAASTYGVTGVAAILAGSRRLTAVLGSYALTGTIAALSASRRLVAAAGSYVSTGTNAQFTYSGGGTGYPSDLPTPTVSVTNTNFGFNTYRPTNLPANTVINAAGSTWTENNSKNANPTPVADCSTGTLQTQFFPVDIQSAGPNLWLYRGRINGIVPQDSDWDSTYCGSAVGIRFQNCPGPGIASGGPTLSDWRIDRSWDGVRIIYSNGFTLQRIYATYCRDDAIENDVQEGGTVRDCLFKYCLNFMACDPSTNPHRMGGSQHILLDGVLVQLRKTLQQGEMTHGSFFKYATDADAATNPRLTIKNCVFAVQDPKHNGFSRQNAAWAKLEASGHSNNYLVNLSSTAMPANYPFPPAHANFTRINQNGASLAAAQAFWDQREAAWLAAHPHLTT